MALSCPAARHRGWRNCCILPFWQELLPILQKLEQEGKSKHSNLSGHASSYSGMFIENDGGTCVFLLALSWEMVVPLAKRQYRWIQIAISLNCSSVSWQSFSGDVLCKMTSKKVQTRTGNCPVTALNCSGGNTILCKTLSRTKVTRGSGKSKQQGLLPVRRVGYETGRVQISAS